MESITRIQQFLKELVIGMSAGLRSYKLSGNIHVTAGATKHPMALSLTINKRQFRSTFKININCKIKYKKRIKILMVEIKEAEIKQFLTLLFTL